MSYCFLGEVTPDLLVVDHVLLAGEGKLGHFLLFTYLYVCNSTVL